MSFQVYYRKWRPQRFSELTGQEHVSTTLRHAVNQGRAAHSYLFCGPRGTGKTSTARIMTKAVNCLDSQDGDPCNRCGPCLAINEGRFMDLIELDAASNRGIDEIRNIRERVNLAPAEGSFKVYIIDEAHMLTEHASNAFLKTLEEPPPHAIFVLCTTEPQKILPTIISRCQRFDFRRLSVANIIERLRTICDEEGLNVEDEALTALARFSEGSLRDAENLLEQLVVSYGESITIQEVSELLGLGSAPVALEFTRYLLLGNTSAALAAINTAAWEGVDLRQLHRHALEMLRGVLMLQYGSRDSLDLPQETVRDLEELGKRASRSRVVKSLKLLGEVNVKHEASSSLPLELAVVEVCLEEEPQAPQAKPVSTPKPATISRPATDGIAAATAAPQHQIISKEDTKEEPVRVEEDPPAPIPQTVPPMDENGSTAVPAQHVVQDEPKEIHYNADSLPQESVELLQEQWTALIKTLSRNKGKRFNIGALLRDCKSQRLEGDTLILAFAHRSHLERMQEELNDPQSMRTMSEALSNSLGAPYQLKLTLMDENGSGNGPSTQSPLVRAALSMGARIMEERGQ